MRRPRKSAVGASAIVATLLLGHVAAIGCTLLRVDIQPTTRENGPIYAGAAAGLEVRFRNEAANSPVTVFPEPPLEIRDRSGRLICSLDGGIWSRGHVFVSSNGRTLVTLEGSGSSADVVFHDTRSCREVDRIDVSEAVTTFGSDRISIGAAPRIKTIRLDSLCRRRTPGGAHPDHR